MSKIAATIRIVLDAEDFKTLVTGGTVSRLETDQRIQTDIILQDIGYVNMMESISVAMDNNFFEEKNKKNELE
ncbi:MAG: hypothetical protein ACXVDV_20045 [Bacteroidia bacterium]